MSRVKFAYTLSSQGDLLTHTIHSIRTLENHVPTKDIIVFFTPPRENKDIQKLGALGVDVREVPGITDEFKIHPLDEPGGYGEKMWCCEVDSDTVVFLDCDTLILEDITNVIAGDFDVKYRPAPNHPPQDSWEQFFKDYGKNSSVPLPNSGFLVFKNRTHKEIRNDWHQYFEMGLGTEFEGANMLDQFSLALSVADKNIHTMTAEEHNIEWVDEVNPNATVAHLYTHHGITLAEAIKNPIESVNRYLRN
jgi:hypothetical protein